MRSIRFIPFTAAFLCAFAIGDSRAAPSAYIVKATDWTFVNSFPVLGGRTFYQYSAPIPLPAIPANLSFSVISYNPPLFSSEGREEFISFILPPRFGTDNSSYGFISFQNASSNAQLSMSMSASVPGIVECVDGSRSTLVGPEGSFLKISSQITCLNTSSVQSAFITIHQVRFGEDPRYKLVVKYEGGNVPSDPIKLEPSRYAAAGCAGGNIPVRKSIFIQCFDETLDAPTDFCSYVATFPNLNSTDLSGHNHGGAPQNGRTPIRLNEIIGLPKEGATIIYEAPEHSGEFDLQIAGKATVVTENGVDAVDFEKVHLRFEVRQPGSEDWVDLNSAGFLIVKDGADPKASHSAGYFGTNAMKVVLDEVAVTFVLNLIEQDDDRSDFPTLLSQGASLPWGGLYDTQQNWSPPHCGHRDGKTIDISLNGFDFFGGIRKPLSNRDLEALQSAVLEHGLTFEFFRESPSCTFNPELPECERSKPNHWHATLKQ